MNRHASRDILIESFDQPGGRITVDIPQAEEHGPYPGVFQSALQSEDAIGRNLAECGLASRQHKQSARAEVEFRQFARRQQAVAILAGLEPSRAETFVHSGKGHYIGRHGFVADAWL